jgi:hypothetical protein
MRRKTRTARGAAILEFAAVIVLGLPLAIMFLFIGTETTHYFAIKSAIDVGARRAARELVIQYNTSNTKNDTVAFLTMPGYIVSSNQFTVTWDTATPPAFVSVSCNYPAGGGPGLAPFPNGPLKYLTDACQFYLGNLTITSDCTMPVQ